MPRVTPRPLLVALVVCLTAAAAPSVARAQLLRGESEYRSDEAWAVEVRVGPYSPDVDSEVSAKPGPHEIYFGRKRRLMVAAELDRELLRVFGTLSVGAQIGYTRETTSAFVDPGRPPDKDTPRSGDGTSFTIVPTSLLLVYRLDVAARRWGIPIVPYGKAGLDYTLYWIRNGNDAIASSGQGGRGRGATTGWSAAAGVALLLDVFDPGAARELDSTTGVNHTYLFGELVHREDSGLFGSNQLHVGDDTWFAGLMFEF